MAQVTQALRNRIVDIARTEARSGIRYSRDNNKYTHEVYSRYVNRQWCNDFVAWVFDTLDGSMNLINGTTNRDVYIGDIIGFPASPGMGYAQNTVSWFNNKGRFVKITEATGNKAPEKGDIVYFESYGSTDGSYVEHVGIVSEVNTATKQIKYISGNSPSDTVTESGWLSYSSAGAKYTPNTVFSNGGLPVSKPGSGQNNLGVAGFGKLGFTSSLPQDSYESNNSRSTAKTLPLARGVASQIPTMNLHNSSDVDYYKFTLSKTGGSHNKITLTSFVNGTQMELLDAGGSRQTSQIVSSANSTKTINLTGKRPGTYYLRISNLSGNSGEYRLTSWNTMSADNKEGNDSMARATSLTGNTGSLSGVNIHAPSDVDYYKFTLDQTGSRDNFIVLSGLYGEQATLLDSRGNVIPTTRNNISLDGKAAGTYYLKVASSSSSGGNYSISWNTARSTVTPSNTQREYEPNNSMSLADHLSGTTGTLKGAIGSTGDEDWFKFTLGSRGTANNKLELTSGANSQRLVLYDANGGKLSGSLSRSLSLSGKAAGTYYVKVYDGVDFASGDYTLSWNTATSSSSSSGSGSSSGTSGSASSNNNSISSAKFLYASSGTRSDSISRSGEQDYFRIQLNSRGTSSNYVQTSFTHSRGDIDMELLDSSGRVLATSNGSGDTERISLSGKSAGTYYVRVKGYRNATNSYNISWNTASNSRSTSAATSRAATSSLTNTQNVMYDSAAGAFAGYLNSAGADTQAVSQSTRDSLRKYGTLVQA